MILQKLFAITVAFSPIVIKYKLNFFDTIIGVLF